MFDFEPLVNMKFHERLQCVLYDFCLHRLALFEKKMAIDQPINWPTNGRTDTHSYLDARTHLKDGLGPVMVSDTLARPYVNIVFGIQRMAAALRRI